MADKIIDNITIFLLEIIGYLAPVSYLILLLSLIPSKFEFNNLTPVLNSEILLIISIYSFGYLVRSFSLLIGKINFLDFRTKIGNKLSKKSFFEKIKKDFEGKSIFKENEEYQTYRSLCLSMYPEINNKVYLFMFRSDLFFDLLTINTFILLIFSIDIFKSNYFLFSTSDVSINILVFIILLLSIIGLYFARYKFFEISYKIPLTHHISKMEKS